MNIKESILYEDDSMMQQAYQPDAFAKGASIEEIQFGGFQNSASNSS